MLDVRKESRRELIKELSTKVELLRNWREKARISFLPTVILIFCMSGIFLIWKRLQISAITPLSV